jgi:DNA-directed RNA polymerase subunit beta'
MGHIELAVPVSHIWFYKCMPSRIGLVLDMKPSPRARDLLRGLHRHRSRQHPAPACQLLTETEYREAQEQYGETSSRHGRRGDPQLLQGRHRSLSSEQNSTSDGHHPLQADRKKLAKRLKLVQGFASSHTSPEWMILDQCSRSSRPICARSCRSKAAASRPPTSTISTAASSTATTASRTCSSSRRPDVIIRNEKRMLQEAVDALFDNGRHGRAVTGAGNRPLKSLSDMLKGKQGRFRQNLLGKRVDYSGRSVIVIGPELKLNQCGLPKKMALVLFEPFIIRASRNSATCTPCAAPRR